MRYFPYTFCLHVLCYTVFGYLLGMSCGLGLGLFACGPTSCTKELHLWLLCLAPHSPKPRGLGKHLPPLLPQNVNFSVTSSSRGVGSDSLGLGGQQPTSGQTQSTMAVLRLSQHQKVRKGSGTGDRGQLDLPILLESRLWLRRPNQANLLLLQLPHVQISPQRLQWRLGEPRGRVIYTNLCPRI